MKQAYCSQFVSSSEVNSEGFDESMLGNRYFANVIFPSILILSHSQFYLAKFDDPSEILMPFTQKLL